MCLGEDGGGQNPTISNSFLIINILQTLYKGSGDQEIRKLFRPISYIASSASVVTSLIFYVNDESKY